MALLKFIIPFLFVTNTNIVLSAVLDLCDTAHEYQIRIKMHCYCKHITFGTKRISFRAECNVEENDIARNDQIWNSFKSLSSIEKLTLSSKNGNLTYIPTEALSELSNLANLIIEHGVIDNVHSFAFANHTMLEEIKLSGNGIHTLAANAFANHIKIKTINLDSNNIEEVKRNVFRNMTELENLFLALNNISIIHDRAFSHLPNLKTLDLQKNSIFVLTQETFFGLKHLTRLELSDNNVEVIGGSTFKYLKDLEALNLANNRIKMLDSRAFHGLVMLQSLSLAQNKISQLADRFLFSELMELTVLDVKNNNMTLFSYETISPIIRNFYHTGSSLAVDDNHFPCDCKLYWLMTLKNNTKNSRLQQILDNLMCYPSAKLAEDFENIEKSHTEEKSDNTNDDYEYYDTGSLNGRLFLSDIPERMLPCENKSVLQQTLPTESDDIPHTTHSKVATTTEQYTVKVTTESKMISSEKRATPYKQLTTVNLTPTTMPSTVKTTEYTTTTTIPTTFRHFETIQPKSEKNQINSLTEKTYSTKFKNIEPTEKIVQEKTVVKSLNENKYATKFKNIEPTEEMVSDGESRGPYASKTNSNDDKAAEMISTSVPKTTHNDYNSRNIVEEKIFEASNHNKQKAPESLSHVHETGNNNSSFCTPAIVLVLLSLMLSLRDKL